MIKVTTSNGEFFENLFQKMIIKLLYSKLEKYNKNNNFLKKNLYKK